LCSPRRLISRTQFLNSLAEIEKIKLNNNVVPAIDGRLHTPDDDCGAESPSHLAYGKAICDRQINYLNSLSPESQARVLEVVGVTPGERIKSILLNNDIHQPGRFLPKEEVAIRNVYPIPSLYIVVRILGLRIARNCDSAH
jgi:hypothetical protein